MQGSNFSEAQDQAGDDIQADSDSLVINLDWRKLIISAFIFWHIFAVSVWLLPDGAPRLAFMNVVAPYMLRTGCWQQWTMFSPSPFKTDTYLEAQIVYGDGTHRAWKFPRMHDLSFPERYQQERFRKMQENTQDPAAKRFWPYLARYAAIRNGRNDPRAFPMKITLVRYYRFIAPPQWRTPDFQAQEFYQETVIQPPLGWSSTSKL